MNAYSQPKQKHICEYHYQFLSFADLTFDNIDSLPAYSTALGLVELFILLSTLNYKLGRFELMLKCFHSYLMDHFQVVSMDGPNTVAMAPSNYVFQGTNCPRVNISNLYQKDSKNH